MRTMRFVLGLAVGVVGCGGSVTESGVGGASGTSAQATNGSTSNGTTTTTSTSGSTAGTGGASTSAQSGTSTSGTGSSSTSNSSNDASSAVSSSATGGGCADCQFPGFDCCDNACVDTNDDILNCGGCGVKCGGAHPFCNHGMCGTPPCQGIACPAFGFCCGTQCCSAGQICCQVDGGPVMGPKCVDPNANGGTCPKGCPACL